MNNENKVKFGDMSRDEQERMEKERDKKMLNNALYREKALENLELEEKSQRRKEVVELQQHYF